MNAGVRGDIPGSIRRPSTGSDQYWVAAPDRRRRPRRAPRRRARGVVPGVADPAAAQPHAVGPLDRGVGRRLAGRRTGHGRRRLRGRPAGDAAALLGRQEISPDAGLRRRRRGGRPPRPRRRTAVDLVVTPPAGRRPDHADRRPPAGPPPPPPAPAARDVPASSGQRRSRACVAGRCTRNPLSRPTRAEADQYAPRRAGTVCRPDHLHAHRRGAAAGDVLVPADHPGLRRACRRAGRVARHLARRPHPRQRSPSA